MTDTGLKGFAVEPKLDCPHLKEDEVNLLLDFLTKVNDKHFSEFECSEYKDKTENWICLQCRQIGCSRYVESHIAKHNSSTNHPVILSFSDASFWCYPCENYIEASSLKTARFALSKAKFSDVIEAKQEHTKAEESTIDKLNNLHITEKESLTLDELAEGFKNKKYQNIIVLTGAGISVAAGIPDFRSPGLGLYSQLKTYDLPSPEAIFDIRHFEKSPQAFNKLAEKFLLAKYYPTLAHQFIRKLNDEKILLCNLTQNIDDLEIQAGLPEQKLIQAHGHTRRAHCIKCHKQFPIEEWKKAIQNEQISQCESHGLIKPDLVFFGEQLPKSFQFAPMIMEKADLVFIMRSSLTVMPFAFLSQMIEPEVPVVLINNTDSLPKRKDKLWMHGNIEDSVKKILEKLDWKV